MPGIFTSLIAASGALSAFDRGLATAQNNVANAGTPGFARQRVLFRALPFEPQAGLPGGVLPGNLESARDTYAEAAVRREQNEWGRSKQFAAGMAGIEPLFEATGESGIPAALSGLFQSFSALSVAPNDAAARRVVLDRAQEVAARFRETASALSARQSETDGGLRSAVDNVNRLAGVIRDWNVHVRAGRVAAEDPNLDAGLYTALEDLAEYVDFTIVRQEDGSVSVLLDGGQSPLVIGDQQYEIAADLSSASARILDPLGADVTAQIGSGRLAGLLELRTVAPAYMDGLDRLAAAFADRINAMLAAGVDANGDPGAALFTYNAGNGAARTLAARPLDIPEIAAASAAAPGGNANALALAELLNAAGIDGLSFTEFYGTLSGRAGRDLAAAQELAADREQRLLQARTLRDAASSVSLDEEALRILEFQRAYEATARLIAVLDELTETTINMLRR